MGDITGGPKTTLAVFCYGGVKQQTVTSLALELRRASFVAGICANRDELLKNDVDIKGLNHAVRLWPLNLYFPHQDALIDRSRALTAKKFLEESQDEVLIMCDHDIEWRTPDDAQGYEGDLLHLARKCAQTRSIVGGLVSKKARGQGVAVLWKPDGENANPNGTYNIGTEDRTVEVYYVGSAFTAYHREVLEAITRTMEDIAPGFTPIFLPAVAEHPLNRGAKLHLSEDWMFAERARRLGYKVWVSTLPLTTHWGEYGYTVVQDANPEGVSQTAPVSQDVKQPPVRQEAAPDVFSQRPVSPPTQATYHDAPNRLDVSGPTSDQTPNLHKVKKISLLHATRGRPERAAATMQDWMRKASGRYEVEYILSIDEDDPNTGFPVGPMTEVKPHCLVHRNRGCVDAYNRAAYASTGDILVQVHDDLEAIEGWDLHLAARLDPDKPQVLHVSDGVPASVNKNPHLITVMICTRKWAQKLGGLFHPEYISVFCDDDASLKAYADECVVEAKDIVLKHEWQGSERDETQRRSYSEHNWKHGEKLLGIRQRNGFPDAPELWGALR